MIERDGSDRGLRRCVLGQHTLGGVAPQRDQEPARERHLETLNQPLPMSAPRLAKLAAEVADIEGEGPFLLVVGCGETGSKATRFVRRFATLEELQEAKRQVDVQTCGPGCWRNHLLYRLVLTENA
jgi:hypothetical protein